MTMQEAAERYRIPVGIFEEYAAFCGEEGDIHARRFTDADIERMSFLMTLHDGGFDASEAARYMKLTYSEENTKEALLHILGEKRCAVLNEIHRRQEQIECLDYLRCMLCRKEKEENLSGEKKG